MPLANKRQWRRPTWLIVETLKLWSGSPRRAAPSRDSDGEVLKISASLQRSGLASSDVQILTASSQKLMGGKTRFVAPFFSSLKALNAACPNMSESDLAAAPLPSINAQQIRICFILKSNKTLTNHCRRNNQTLGNICLFNV